MWIRLGIISGIVCAALGTMLLIKALDQRFGNDWMRFSTKTPPKTDQIELTITKSDSVPVIEASIPVVESVYAPPKEISSKQVKINQPEPVLVHLDPDTESLKKIIVEKTANQWQKDTHELLVKTLTDPRVEFRTPVIERITRHVETKAQYSHQTDSMAIQMCLDFINGNEDKVKPAIGKTRVPFEIVIAILKVESNFGKWKSPESVFNVYWTLSIADDHLVRSQYPDLINWIDPQVEKKLKRMSKWSTQQLHDLIKVNQLGVYPDILDIRGSWAGAFGLCQFIPTSYLAYGKDGDNDGLIDLYNIADASASIANYLEKNHWPKDSDREKKKKSLMRYNQSEPYAEAVLSLADAIKSKLSQTALVTQ